MDEVFDSKLKQLGEQTAYILNRLEGIRDTLKKANESVGYLARFGEMKAEIKQVGWSGICAKYHPEVNIGDPAAYELFQLYRFVYDNMDR